MTQVTDREKSRPYNHTAVDEAAYSISGWGKTRSAWPTLWVIAKNIDEATGSATLCGREIAAQAHCHIRTVRRHLKALKLARLIHVVGTAIGSNTYKLGKSMEARLIAAASRRGSVSVAWLRSFGDEEASCG
jgi:hypothetical protein